MKTLLKLLSIASLSFVGANAFAGQLYIEHCNAGIHATSEVNVYDGGDGLRWVAASKADMPRGTNYRMDCAKNATTCTAVINPVKPGEKGISQVETQIFDVNRSHDSHIYFCVTKVFNMSTQRDRFVVTELPGCSNAPAICGTPEDEPLTTEPVDNSTIVYNKTLTIKSHNFSSHCMRHTGYYGYIHTCESNNDDFKFNIVPGLSGVGVSLESINYPGYYLRHSNYELMLDSLADSSNQTLLKNDASFYVDKGFADSNKVSLRASNLANMYIRHSSYKLSVGNIHNDLDKNDATFEFVIE